MDLFSPQFSRGLAASGLLALPAGLALGAPAAAQSLPGSYRALTVDLANYGGALSITSGITLSPASGPALYGAAGQPGAITNAGTITTRGTAQGILLGGGGVVNNQVSGRITAGSDGILAQSAAASVVNAGQIAAGNDGISLNHGGQLLNAAGALVTGGHMGVYTGNGAGMVANSGMISAAQGDAVSLYGGGSLLNNAGGEILGGYSGVFAGGSSAMIQNAGSISGAEFGVYLAGAGSLTNTGSIAGGKVGILAVAPGASVTNSGVIQGGNFGVRMAAEASLTNSGSLSGGSAGASLGAASRLDNSGLISGSMGVLVSGGGSTITNTGTIASTAPGGDALAFVAGNDTLILGTGAVVAGAIDGGFTASQISLTGTGVLSSDLRNFGPGGALTVLPGADWTGAGNWDLATLDNAGTLQPGKAGAPLVLGGNFIQASSGTLRIVVTPAGISALQVAGTAQLGGTLAYVLAPGRYAPAQDAFLTAAGGVTGRFAAVVTPQTAAASQQPASGVSATSLVTSAANPAAASAVAVAPAAASLQVVAVANTAVLQVSRRFTVAPADAQLAAEAGQALGLTAERQAGALLGHDRADPHGACAAIVPVSGLNQASATLAGAFCAAGGWLQVSGSATRLPGDRVQSGGFLAGIDRPVGPGARLGAAVGYDDDTLRDAAGGSARTGMVRLGLYASDKAGGLRLSAGLLAGIGSTDTARQTGAGDADASVAAFTLSGAVQAALPLRLAGVAVLPAAGLEFAAIRMGSFGETAAQQAFALRGAASGGLITKPYLALTLRRGFVPSSGWQVAPWVSLGVADQLGSAAPALLTAADGTRFSSRAGRLDPVAGQAGAGLEVRRGGVAFTARYQAEAAGNWSMQTAEAALNVTF
ncbi:MAG: hypothetical protein B7Z80_26160 [Rhodospirillales bacterium 20-64-7]|nr:MAG: hypothetical protein B7Z80_26160 [Rhodospirillales bacterium 20-64-7]